jgi:hypothetical protein
MPKVSKKEAGVGCVVLGGGAVAIYATLAAGVPTKLPAVALGSDVLLHAERAAALFWGYVLILVVVGKAFRGKLPIEFSTTGARYSDVAEAAEGAITALERRVEAAEGVVTTLVAAVSDQDDRLRDTLALAEEHTTRLLDLQSELDQHAQLFTSAYDDALSLIVAQGAMLDALSPGAGEEPRESGGGPT